METRISVECTPQSYRAQNATMLSQNGKHNPRLKGDPEPRSLLMSLSEMLRGTRIKKDALLPRFLLDILSLIQSESTAHSWRLSL